MQDNPYEIIQITKNTRIKQRIRAGSDYERKQITLSLGELGFTTDTERLFVGDGVTPGGVPVSVKYRNTITNLTEAQLFENGDMFLYQKSDDPNSPQNGLYVMDNGTPKFIVGSLLQSASENIQLSLFDIIYPIGTVHFTTKYYAGGTDVPFSIGTWTLVETGKYIKTHSGSVGGGDIGGRASFTIAENNLPNMTNTISINNVSVSTNGSHTHTIIEGSNLPTTNGQLTSGDDFTDIFYKTQTTTPNGAHTHRVTIPPFTINIPQTPSTNEQITLNPSYIQMYAWKRTA